MIELSQKIIQVIETARTRMALTVNVSMISSYFEIGRMIVDELQNGQERAKYGSNLLKQVSKDLTMQLGKGFSVQNLERMRNFYSMYSNSSNELRNF